MMIMGTKNSDEWPYLLCISIAQENMIREYFKQENIKIDTFFRVPNKYYNLIVDILHSYGAEHKGKPHLKNPTTFNDTNTCSSLTVDGILFKHVEGFDDVFKLVDKHRNNEKRQTVTDFNKLNETNYTSHPRNKEKINDQKVQGQNKDNSKSYEMQNETLYNHIDNSLDDIEDHTNDEVDNLSDVTVHIDVHDQESGKLHVDLPLNTTDNHLNNSSKVSSNRSSNSVECSQNGQSDLNIDKTPNTPNFVAKRNKKKHKYSKLKGYMERKEKFKCNECGKVMASQKFYNRHMQMKHSRDAVEKKAARKKRGHDGQLMNVCHICQKQFSDKYCLQSHITNMHNDSKEIYQCDLCGAIMKFKGNLVQHMKAVHTDKRPHNCDVCGKSFKILQQLKNHMKQHDPSYIETCAICGKTVKKGQISGHMKRHSNNRPHKCTSCDKSFHEKQDLTRHLRIHRGEKPYKCPQCSYVTAIKGNLTKHLKHVKHNRPCIDRHKGITALPATHNNFFTFLPRDDVIRSEAEVPIHEQSVYVVSRDVIPQPESLPEKQVQVLDNTHNPILYRDLNTEPVATVDKPGPKLEVLKNMETIESVNSIVNENDNREPYSGVDMFSYHVPTKMIISDHMPAPASVSHIELTKISPSVHVISNHTSELVPGYSHETVIYQTGKADGSLDYTEDQRQYGEGAVVEGESSSQYRDHYMSYMMPADPRYPYTSQY